MILAFLIKNYFLISKLIICLGAILLIYGTIKKEKVTNNPQNRKIITPVIDEKKLTNTITKKNFGSILVVIGLSFFVIGIVICIIGIIVIIMLLYMIPSIATHIFSFIAAIG